MGVLKLRLVGFGVAALALITDLAVKAVGLATLSDGPIDVPGPLDLELVLNPGVAFGMGARTPTGLVLMVTAAVSAGIGALLWRGRLPALGGGLILGGAIGNVVDRYGDGAVVDVFALDWFPTFNLADVWITVGVALIMLTEILPRSLGADHGTNSAPD